MKERIYLTIDQDKVHRMTKNPPSLLPGQRFLVIDVNAPDELWAERPLAIHKVEAMPDSVASIEARPSLDLGTVDGICFGPAIPYNHVEGHWTDTRYKCPLCGYTNHTEWDEGKPHYEPEPAEDAQA